MSRGTSRYCCILIITLAFLWTFVGALINFHQHQIFGKELIEKAYPNYKPKTKDKLTYDCTVIDKLECTILDNSILELKTEMAVLVLESYHIERLFQKKKIPDQEFDQRPAVPWSTGSLLTFPLIQILFVRLIEPCIALYQFYK